MTLNDFSCDRRLIFADVPCLRTDSGEISAAIGRIETYGIDEFLLKNRDNSFTFRITDTEKQNAVRDCLRRRMPGLVTVDGVARGEDGRNRFCLRVVFFLRSKNFGRFQVILSNKAKATLAKHGYDATSYEKLAEVFHFKDGVSEDFCFAFQSSNTIINEPEDKERKKKTAATDAGNIVAEAEQKDETNANVASDVTDTESGNAQATKSKAVTEENDESAVKVADGFAEEETDKGENITKDSRFLKICGKDFSLLVTIDGAGANCRAMVYSVVPADRETKSDILPWKLAYGTLMFSDEQSVVANRVREMLNSTPNYIKIWNEYAQREGDFLLKRARAVGEISYLPQFNITDVGMELIVEDNGKGNLSNIAVGDYVQACPEMPPYIVDENMNWAEYKEWKTKQLEILGVKKLPVYPSFQVKDKSTHSITLSQDNQLPKDSKLYFSIYGNELQIDRRESARSRIENGTSASPTLGFILGSNDESSAEALGLTVGKQAHIEPLSNILRQKIFKNPPTSAQIKAIDIAINTPDIAIIQGPPGTGKTTVITAILERLNELSKKNNAKPGQVLVTSLQHDAVHNIIERVNINSLPTIKFGTRKGEENLSLQEEIRKWCKETLDELEKKHPRLKQTEDEKKLFTVYNAYLQSPSDTKAMAFLNLARHLTSDKELVSEIDGILEDMTPPKSVGNDEFLKKIYRLRTNEVSFRDDGQINAMDLYNDMEALYGTNLTVKQSAHLSALRDFAMTDEPDADTFEKIKCLREQLLADCIGAPPFEDNEVRDDITEIYGRIKESLQRPEDTVENIIYDFYSELRDNPFNVFQSVGAYSFVFAATAQQTEKEEIKRAKGMKNPGNKDTHAEYDTVVVDEAARVNPGDLMIPLSQAARRIILVGDQRQLPHMYDEEIFQTLRDEEILADEGDIKTSMFEHLWKKAEELHKADGIERRVTLDAQYRMHPRLGNFVSDNFYKPYGEPFTSPLPPSAFEQSICPSPIRWVHMPAERGVTRRTNNYSLIRDCEVDYIVDTLKDYLADPQNEKLTFGVISFYRAQTRAIIVRLKKLDLDERVRVGTVDEFQGMEFDVMFLSVVRSRTDFTSVSMGKKKFPIDIEELERVPADADEDRERHEKYVQTIGSNIYGFLTDNRLCVALSRQKRLLIVVGDADMFGGEQSKRIARVCVPSMYNLYELCREENSFVMH